MSPAFSSARQAAAFAGLLLLLILLPMLVGKQELPPRSEVYSSISWRLGDFPFMHRKIFGEIGCVDIAFVGSSRLNSDIDVPYVRKELSRHLGRNAEVFSLGWPFPGFDTVYFVLRDLLAHRDVKMLVINEEYRRKEDGPHPASFRWFRWGDDAYATEGLPMYGKVGLYAGAILGMPHNLVNLLRPNLPVATVAGTENYWENFYHALPFSTTLGALTARIGYDYDPNYVVFEPKAALEPSDFFIYSEVSKSAFRFGGPPTPPYQLHFARLIAGLARAHGVKLVVMHMPDIREAGPAVPEREYWPSVFQMGTEIIGIPPEMLFEGINPEDVTKFFYDGGHFNQNGQRYFTPLVTPALIKIYDSKTETR